MSKLVICKGLPGSGKTTYAKDLEGYIRVNKDDIRRKLEEVGWVWSRENEKDVIIRRDLLITQALKDGKNVVSDDTNLAKKHINRLQEIAARFSATVEIKDFTDVPIEVCIERDSKREGKAKVGEKVIRNMAKQFSVSYGTKPEPYQRVAGLPWGIICDLDGTLCLHNGRGPYDTEKCLTDLVNIPVYEIIEMFSSEMGVSDKILYVSGREEKFRDLCRRWLKDNLCPDGELWMRPTGDMRNDAIVKSEIFDREIRGKYNIRFVLDDRDRVVKMWRDLGLTCLQVNYGNF